MSPGHVIESPEHEEMPEDIWNREGSWWGRSSRDFLKSLIEELLLQEPKAALPPYPKLNLSGSMRDTGDLFYHRQKTRATSEVGPGCTSGSMCAQDVARVCGKG